MRPSIRNGGTQVSASAIPVASTQPSCCTRWQRSRAEAGIALRAVHVDHGLQPGSADAAERCRLACLQFGIPFGVIRLGLEPSTGESIEAAAREARYAALEGQLAPGEWLLTAHHRDDQLETVLIQLLRGAGVAGLAAMPARARLGQGWHARPLLEVDRAELADYAARESLSWQQDPMNDETRFDRSWLRARVLPAIRERWPAAASTVARSASHLAEASKLLAEVAANDATGVLDGGCLSLEGLKCLSRERRVNLLRWWLRQQGLRPPPAARLAAAMRAFFEARRDAAPCMRWDGGEVRRYRGRLYALPPLPGPPELCNTTGRSLELGTGLGRFELVPGTEGGLAEPLQAAIAIPVSRGRREPAAASGPAAQASQGSLPGSGRRALDAGPPAAGLRGRATCGGWRPLGRCRLRRRRRVIGAQARLDREAADLLARLRLSASIRRCCRSRPSRTPCAPRGQSPRIAGIRCPAPGFHRQSRPP